MIFIGWDLVAEIVSPLSDAMQMAHYKLTVIIIIIIAIIIIITFINIVIIIISFIIIIIIITFINITIIIISFIIIIIIIIINISSFSCGWWSDSVDPVVMFSLLLCLLLTFSPRQAHLPFCLSVCLSVFPPPWLLDILPILVESRVVSSSSWSVDVSARNYECQNH